MKIRLGIPEAHCEAAAALYWGAFGGKLGRILGPEEKAMRFIKSVLRTDHGIYAEDADGTLLGIAGFKSPQGALVSGEFPDLRVTYGWLGAGWRIAILSILERDIENERFLIDGLFVAPDARGQGVGKALLAAVYTEARKRGYRQVRLDVIDTNPRAKALYLQEGFQETTTAHIGWP